MQNTHLPDLAFSQHFPADGATPSSLFETTATYPPSTGSGSSSSSSPEQDPLTFLDSTTPSVLPGLTLPKGLAQQTKPKRGRPPSTRSESPTEYDVLVKRQRNNVAAKKYRQKKIDRIEELEEEVDEVKKERDELRIRLARQEAETKALREMLKLKMGGNPEGG
ncbi:hypothetical protein B0T14DRAFT_508049 [Immersiella caudata]|uniref:BZIP domain-containing protein n=1 Tax=Immersiella caudata TaxID=314043 RepID=A0AA39XHR6_9PEZI|nr:hypothetical protein B0T14DRAFT_508049 [Immersiella caudata]